MCKTCYFCEVALKFINAVNSAPTPQSMHLIIKIKHERTTSKWVFNSTFILHETDRWRLEIVSLYKRPWSQFTSVDSSLSNTTRSASKLHTCGPNKWATCNHKDFNPSITDTRDFPLIYTSYKWFTIRTWNTTNKGMVVYNFSREFMRKFIQLLVPYGPFMISSLAGIWSQADLICCTTTWKFLFYPCSALPALTHYGSMFNQCSQDKK